MKAKYLVFITAIISICVTYYNLEIVKLNNEQTLELSKIHEERDWKYKMTEFMAKYKKDIFSDDLETRQNIQKIMMISFPKNITSNIFNDLAKISQQNDWLNAINILKRIDQPTVYIQIAKGFPEKVLEPIADTIACGDISYVTNDEYVNNSLKNSNVRYFLEEDKKLAEIVLKDFTEMICREGYIIDLKLLPLTKNRDRNLNGTIEVWLSPKDIKKVTDKNNKCYYKEPHI
ncbi:MAG: hypothetical protein LGB78_04395 [Sulfurovum sp.]|nr:hypothetical protein [Sulfurovum sp.]MCB4763129.1 hypothetical protein [Sulfurovum sp.]MCB4773335.1 hypothetical protein [Sulfurovum sp.]MCB4780978.1 hypothetical protein [Sulfurovum sp.]MCB4782623.1 hypothetical protein [Sulfurovum sp.]